MHKILREKIINKKIKIGVIGLGYVGLPLAIEFSKADFYTYGFDIDKNKIGSLRRGRSYIQHIPLGDYGSFHPTDNFEKLKSADCIIICVPTPISEAKEPDLSCVINTAETIARYLRKGHIVVLESTTYPGTTDDVLRPIFEKTGLTAGRDFYLAFSPEREDPGNKNFSTRKIPKVVGGIDRVLTELAGEINIRMPEYVLEKIINGLSSRKRSLKGTRILILGLSYKKDIGNPRESPAFKVIELLEDRGAINDPYIPVSPSMRRFKIEKRSIKLSPEIIKRYHCVVIVTDHCVYDYAMIRRYAKLIVDTRNAIKKISKNVIKA